MNSNWFKELFINQAKPAINANGGGVSEEAIENSVKDYLEENPVTGGMSEEEVKNIVEDHLEKNPVSGGSGKAIIDVVELPTENINESAFYRLLSTEFVYWGEPVDEFTCYCVDGLPENPLPVTTDMESALFYYNVQDGAVSGYVDAMVSAGSGLPVGWYAIDILAQAFDVQYGGTITSISDSKNDNYNRLLLKYDTYVYNNGWLKIPFAYEFPPKFDVTWDGDMTGRPALDMSMLGYANGVYFVKVSDDVFTTDEVIGGEIRVDYYNNSFNIRSIDEGSIDTSTYPGAFTIDNYVVIVHDENMLASALGIPAGMYPNGVYFYLYTEERYVSRFTGPSSVIKIDSKFIDGANDNLHPVATSGSWYDLIDKPAIYNDVVRYDSSQALSTFQKSNARANIDVYSKAEVENLLSTAIGSAIGGSY